MTKSRFHKLHKLFFFIAKKNLKQPSKGLSMRGINYGRELLSIRAWTGRPPEEEYVGTSDIMGEVTADAPKALV
jgi:hypothetical protein